MEELHSQSLHVEYHLTPFSSCLLLIRCGASSESGGEGVQHRTAPSFWMFFFERKSRKEALFFSSPSADNPTFVCLVLRGTPSFFCFLGKPRGTPPFCHYFIVFFFLGGGWFQREATIFITIFVWGRGLRNATHPKEASGNVFSPRSEPPPRCRRASGGALALAGAARLRFGSHLKNRW